MNVLIFGCGYLGTRVARRWLAAGNRVHVLTRTAERARELSHMGLLPILGDVAEPPSLTGLPACDVVLFAVGYDRQAPHSKREVYVNGLRNALGSPAGAAGRWISISSTSVYGQSSGEWVNEDVPTQPATDGGQICLDAESVVQDWSARTGNRATVLRLSGIYGPDRLLSRADQLRRGVPLEGSPEAWLNLIHVDDAAEIVVRTAELPGPPEVLLVTDDEPIERREYYGRLAQLASAPAPEFLNATPVELNKRCSNERLKKLGYELRFATIRTGLLHAWEASRGAT